MSLRHATDQWLHMIETAMQGAPDAVLITDNGLDEPGPRILFANEAMVRLSGYSRAELVGQTPRILQGSRTDREALERIRGGLADGRAVQEDLLNYKKDGSSFWIGLSISPLRDAAGHSTYFLAIGRDITQRKRAENEKKAAEQLLSAVFAGVEVGVLVQDEGGVIVLANPAVSRLLRLRVSDLVGRSADQFIDRSLKPAGDAPPAAHGTSQRQIRWRNPDGESFELLARSTNVRHADGRRFRVLTLQSQGAPAAIDVRSEFQRAVQERNQPAAGRVSLIAGHVQLVGLGEVRSAFGSNWPQVAERSHQIATQIIREHLTADDVYAPANDDSYVLCFGALSEDEAARQAGLIAQEVRLALITEFGEPELGKIAAHAATVEIEAHEMDGGAQGLVDLVASRLSRARQTLETQARVAVRNAIQDEAAEYHRIVTGEMQQSPLWLVQLPERVHTLVDRSRRMLPGRPEITLEVDAHLLGKAAELIFADCRDGAAPFLIVPVDWLTLSQKREAALYFGLCREIAEPVRQRIFFEVTGLAQPVGLSRVGEVLGRLRQFGRGVAIELAAMDRNFLPLSEYRVDFLTLDERMVHVEREYDRALLARLQKGLRLWKSRLVVKNVQHRGACRQLASLGVELMTGAPFVGRPLTDVAAPGTRPAAKPQQAPPPQQQQPNVGY